ncbi:MAG TPA: PilZ domain-containing protein [Clostridia bacterium]|nr:PilZ domain-containing protein [Clostridia bacterium]
MAISASIPDMRSSVRFPLRLPMSVWAETHCFEAETKDISAGGVLFRIEKNITVGSTIEFTISMPATVMGASKDVLVNCIGRVVRCCPDDDRCAVAAVIDEYTFER